MARSVETIQQGIIDNLDPAGNNLSTSKFATWRLLSYAVAFAINLFEVILDLFRAEIDQKAYTSAACSLSWYEQICRQFQYGHTLVYDPKTAGYDYAVDDPDARIVKMVAIGERKHEGNRTLHIKLARQDDNGNMVPLSSDERRDFISYIERRGGAGIPTTIISTVGDTILYDLEIYYDPAYPRQTVEQGVYDALAAFKTSLSFDAKFYPQRLVDRVMSATGVVTVNPVTIEHKTSVDTALFSPVGVAVELAAGYFEYDKDKCNLTFIATVEG